MTDQAKIFRFVRHEQVQFYLDAGWIKHRSLEGTHHGQWSALIEWPFADRPPEAPKDIPLAG